MSHQADLEWSGVVRGTTNVESFIPSVADLGRRALTFDGLGFQNGWFFARVEMADGRRFDFMRQHQVGFTCMFFAIEMAADIFDAPIVRLAPQPGHDAFYWGPIDYLPSNSQHILEGRNPLYPRFAITVTPEQIHWIEGDWLELTMDTLGPAMRYRCPGPPDDFGLTSQVCRVTGKVDGQPVTGFGGYDRHYGEHGIPWFQGKGHYLEEWWYVWGAETSDGRYEYGVAATGRAGYSVGFFHRDGAPPVVANSIWHEPQWSERAGVLVPSGSRFGFKDRSFECQVSGTFTPPLGAMLLDSMCCDIVEVGGPAHVRGAGWLAHFKHPKGSVGRSLAG